MARLGGPGLTSIGLWWTGRDVAARAAAALAVTAILWVGPSLLEGALTIAEGAASRAALDALLASIGAGAVVLVPLLLPDPDDRAPRPPPQPPGHVAPTAPRP